MNMRFKRLLATGLLSTLSVFVSVVPQSADAAAADVARAPRDAHVKVNRDDLSAPILNRGEVRVIVGIRPTPGFARRAAVADDDEKQRDVLDQQNRLLARMHRHGIRNVKQFRLHHFAAMTVDSAALDVLLADSEVTSIAVDRPLYPVLSDTAGITRADKAWLEGYRGAGQAVAIIDSGVDTAHPFFAGKIIAEACFSHPAGDGYSSYCPNPDPPSAQYPGTHQIGPGAGINCPDIGLTCWHGTHVAGIAAGKTGVLSPTAGGMAPDANIIPIQVFQKDCSSGPCAILAFDSDIINALEYVYSLRTTYNIASANLSLGGGLYTASCDAASPAMTAVIGSLRNARIATVIASGNSGSSNALGFPACISTAISVGSTTKANAISSFSNSSNLLSLLAPGGGIISSVPGGGFGGASGTSMATPHVAGAWALLKSAKPTATVLTVLSALQNGGLPITDARNGITKKLIQLGYDATTLGALGTILGHGNALPTISIASPVNGATFAAPASISFTVTANDIDGGVAKVEYFSGATKLFESTTAPFSFTWSNVAAGSYALTAKATDVLGATTVSAPVNVTVSQINFQLSGRVLSAGAPVGGVAMSASGAAVCTASDALGQYGCTVPSNWSGTVTPVLAPYVFLPALRSYTNVTAAQVAQDYAVTGVVASSLAGHWRFEEGSGGVAGDSSGNGNAGTLRNGASWAVGQLGGGIQLDGSTQDVVVAASPSLSITGTGLTLAAWIYPTAANNGSVIHKQRHFSLLRNADGSLTYADSATWSYATIGNFGSTPLNTWSHVAVTFDGSAIRFYVNGLLVGTVNRAGALTDNANALYLGSYDGTYYKFAGKLDEAQVFGRTLSAAEVANLAAAQAQPDTAPPSVPAGLSASAINANGLTLSWSASTDNVAVAGYKVYRDGVQVGTATNPLYIDSGLSPSTTYSYTVAAYDAAGNNSAQSAALPVTTNSTPPPPTGLVGHWRFEEGSGGVAGDSSGNGNAGTLRNGASWAVGQLGGGIQLDGSTQDVVVADSPSLSITGTGLTLAAWIYPTAANNGSVIHKERHFSLLRNADGSLTYADSATWSYATIGNFGSTPLNTWSHVAVTFDGSAIRFYVNGLLVGTVNRAGALTDNANALYLGSYDGTYYKFAGKLDEAQVFGRTLSAAEVANLAIP